MGWFEVREKLPATK